ncbi:MAG: hypothetical protein ACTSYA_07560 [Candidatus Kariarchaeaceae archaeon]
MRLVFILLGYFALGNLIGLIDTLLRSYISDELSIKFWDFLDPNLYIRNPYILFLALTSILQFGVYLRAFGVASEMGGAGTASIGTAAGMFIAALFVAINYTVFAFFRDEKLSSLAIVYLVIIIILQLFSVGLIYLLLEELETTSV